MWVTTFDLDDTLFPELEYARSGFRTAGALVEEEFDVEGAADQLIAWLEEGERHNHFDLLVEEFDLPESLVDRLIDVYRSHDPDISFCNGAPEAIERAREFGKVAVLTDGPSLTQRPKIEALGLEKRVDFIVVTGELEGDAWKPSPAGYRAIMDHFGVDGEACCYLGDNPTKDFITAKKLDWRTVHLDHPGQMYDHRAPDEEHEAEYRVERLGELFDIWPPVD